MQNQKNDHHDGNVDFVSIAILTKSTLPRHSQASCISYCSMPDKHWSIRRTKADKSHLGTNMTTYNVMVFGVRYTGFMYGGDAGL